MLYGTVRGAGLPSGLTSLLMKLGLTGKMADGKGLVAKGEKGMEGSAKEGGAEGPGKGALMGEDGALLSGLGYNTADHRSSAKNISERANLEKFLKEMGPETGAKGELKEPGAEQSKGAEAKDKAETPGQPKEAKDAPADNNKSEARRETADEARVQGQAEAKEAAEARETRETQEAESGQQQRQQKDEQDEEDKPGAGWLAEEFEERDEDRKAGLRTPDAMGNPNQCRGTLDDGSRCLRKPVKGMQHCREHFVPPTPPIQPV